MAGKPKDLRGWKVSSENSHLSICLCLYNDYLCKNISEMDISDELINGLKARKEELEIQLSQITRELQKINRALNSLSEDDSYFAWTEEAYSCIQSNDKILQTTEILNYIFYENPEQLGDERRKRNSVVGLSVALNKMVRGNRLKKIVITGIKGHFYGLPEWFDELGRPLNEYLDKLLNEVQKKPMPWVI